MVARPLLAQEALANIKRPKMPPKDRTGNFFVAYHVLLEEADLHIKAITHVLNTRTRFEPLAKKYDYLRKEITHARRS